MVSFAVLALVVPREANPNVMLEDVVVVGFENAGVFINDGVDTDVVNEELVVLAVTVPNAGLVERLNGAGDVEDAVVVTVNVEEPKDNLGVEDGTKLKVLEVLTAVATLETGNEVFVVVPNKLAVTFTLDAVVAGLPKLRIGVVVVPVVVTAPNKGFPDENNSAVLAPDAGGFTVLFLEKVGAELVVGIENSKLGLVFTA